MKNIKNKKRLALALVAVVALLVPALSLWSAPANVLASEHEITAPLVAVGGSGVSGHVTLVQRPQEGGTLIHVVAHGLQPGGQYVSLYYDNSTCTLPGDVLSSYSANSGGTATAKGTADDDLDEIDSVSVRVAGTLELLACAAVHP